MNFVAIDFETANASRASACAIGLTVVENGAIAKSFQRLIRPSELFNEWGESCFDPFNVMIHGITEEDVKNEPEFNELWPSIAHYFSEQMIVAHHASFDISVLKYVCDEYEMPYPEFHYSCTRIISKRMWSDLVSHSLDVVADYLGIKFTHHKAEDDALACSQIAIRACQEVGVASLPELAEKLEFQNGHLFPGGYKAARLHLPSYHEIRLDEIVPSTDEFDPAHDFYSKTLVFTGQLDSMTRKEAMQKVVDVGGKCSKSVNRSTSFLVTGQQDFRRLTDGKTSNKIKKVEHLISQGYDIEIIPESEFVRMLGVSINRHTLESILSGEDEDEVDEIDDFFDSIEDWDEFERQVEEAGKYKGKHYSEYYNQVEQLKAGKKHHEAIELLLELVATVEREAGVSRRGVGGYSYLQLAIIYRKEKRFDEEVEILERYAEQHKAPGVAQRDLAERLGRARQLRRKHRA
jgi:DNA polymerase-3 subunit epsilon